MAKFKFSILLINLIILNYVSSNENTLKNLFVVHRHGDRTPVTCYANDPYGNESLYWPDGFGQLTSAGKRRMYNIGVFLRDKYDDFLGDSIRNVDVRSSDKDRCLESTQLVVNGAFKPKGRWVWEINQKWIPIPIHTYPNYMDSMLYPSSRCTAASEEDAKIVNSNYVKSINKKYENLYKYLTLNSGQNVDNVLKVSYLYDTLMNEKIANYQLPAWATFNVLEQMKELNVISFQLMSLTRRIQQLRSGVFLDDLTKKIKNAIIKPPKKGIYDNSVKKLNVYSSHDTFVNVVLSALQINNGLPPPYGSTIIFELHQHNESGSWDESNSIKILYLNQTETNRPFELKIPACESSQVCTIKQFISSISDLILSPQQWNKECKKSLLKETAKLTSGTEIETVESLMESRY